MKNLPHDFINANTVFDLRKNKWAVTAHSFGVTFHDFEIGAHCVGEIGFVDDEQIGLSNARTALTGNLVAPRNIDDLDGEIGKFATETSGQIVAARFNQEDFGVKFLMEFLEREQVCRNVLANGGVRATAGFHGPNAFGFEGFMFREKFAIFLRENVVGNGSDVPRFAEAFAELKHQGSFSAPDWPANPYGEGALIEIAVERMFAIVKMAGKFGV
jgi:hypothetical protein